MIYGIAEALHSLYPDAQWTLRGPDWSGLEWRDESPMPEYNAVVAEIQRLNEDYRKNEYKSLRAAEYPDFKDYLDGIVKGDQEQIQQYIDACLEIKAKYPKPE